MSVPPPAPTIRIPDSPDTWTQLVHDSGRIFLSNTRTTATRWLWQKWDINDRLFVRSIANPTQTLWVDAMDLPTRLASGTASAAEVAQYRASSASSAPPPQPTPPLPAAPMAPQTRTPALLAGLPAPPPFHYAPPSYSTSAPVYRANAHHAAPSQLPPPPPPPPPPPHAYPPQPSGSGAHLAQTGFRPPAPPSRFRSAPAFSSAPPYRVPPSEPVHPVHQSHPPGPFVHAYEPRSVPPSAAPFHRPPAYASHVTPPAPGGRHLAQVTPQVEQQNLYFSHESRTAALPPPPPPPPPTLPMQDEGGYGEGYFGSREMNEGHGRFGQYREGIGGRPSGQHQRFEARGVEMGRRGLHDAFFRPAEREVAPKRDLPALDKELKPKGRKQKRFQDGPVLANGRYFSKHEQSGNGKRHRNGKEYGGNRKAAKSRFATLPLSEESEESVHKVTDVPPRLAPMPLALGRLLSARARGGFRPTTKIAMRVLQSCTKVGDSEIVGGMHDRDFVEAIMENGGSPCSVQDANADDESSFEPVVGTCEDIEKVYLRLTAAPKPSAVRPPHILKQSLLHIKRCWAEVLRDYDWACKQLKSVRQDYKVQHVEDIDVVDVYETHARIALENSDLGEFNTCVAQAQELHKKIKRPVLVQDEFLSYRILYNLLVGASKLEQGQILARCSAAERKREATAHALRIRQAVISGNYHCYFKLSLNPPPKTMISYLLVHFHNRVRFRAISTMTSAYGPGQPGHIPLLYVLSELGWGPDNSPHVTAKDGLSEQLRKCAEDANLLDAFCNINIFGHDVWVLEALTHLITIGTVLKVDQGDKPALARLLVDLKATKTKGLREPVEGRKLITHAGS